MSLSNLHARTDQRQFRWVYAVIFTIALVPATFSRLRRGASQKSIIDQARMRTGRIAPFFFMG